MPHRSDIAIILNRGSGKQKGENRGPMIRRAFEDLQVKVRVFDFRKGNDLPDAVERAIRSGATTIVAAGGDGTVCGVAEEISGKGVTLGILPLGTFNYFARSLDLPLDIEEAARVISDGQAQDIRMARINNRVFLNNASIGAYAAILETREGVYRRWGRSRLAAYWSVAKTLITFRAPMRLEVEVEGKTYHHRTAIAFAINNAFQLDQMGIEGRDCIEEGKMVLLIAPDTTRMGLMKHALALALGRARHRTDYEMHCASEIRIKARGRDRLVARDGEQARQKGPFHFAIDPEPQPVLTPVGAPAGVR